MSFNGFEIDMLNVGDADCILVTQWQNNTPARVLIDGGSADTVAELTGFLRDQGIFYIEHMVCTHPHNDHAGGLVKFLNDKRFQVGTAWIHRPELHADLLKVELALGRTHGMKRVQVIRETLETASNLINLCKARGIPIQEPFAGQQIGCLVVVGPSEKYYTELLAQFADSSKIQASEEVLNQCESQDIADDILERIGRGGSDVLMDNPQTQPENNSSVMLATIQQSGKYLFTADAGAQTLALAAQAYDLSDCHWMQIPHHGSRRNITKSLIEYFSPKIAYVSASGSRKHPRQAVVNAFKDKGASVYSTHYPSPASKWHHRGDVPQRAGYSSATPLWKANQ